MPQIQENADGFEHWVINWDSIVFDTKEVESFEKTNPGLCTKTVCQSLPTNMDGYSCLKSVLLSEEILNRWSGMEPWELAEKIDNKIKDPLNYDFPVPYWMRKHKVNSATEAHIYFCEQINTTHPYSDHYNGNEILYDFEMIALNMRDVLEWEKGKDWLFFVDPNQHPDNTNDSSKCTAKNSDEWVSFWDLTNLFKSVERAQAG